MHLSARNPEARNLAVRKIVTPGFAPGVCLSKMMDGRTMPGRDS